MMKAEILEMGAVAGEDSVASYYKALTYFGPCIYSHMPFLMWHVVKFMCE